MRFRTLLWSAALALIVPGAALAATIESHTSSYSNTGGIVVEAGESVSSKGGSASASVSTYISGDENGGTANVIITTEKNGEVTTEEHNLDIPAGEAAPVIVSTSTATSVNINTSVPTPATVPSAVAQAGQVAEKVAAHVATALGATTSEVNALEATTTNLLASPALVGEPLPEGWISSVVNGVVSFFSNIFASFMTET
ncbi:hypothetical protein C4568_01640 [Candidatus Parcubacteria bacterium]|nr:MAG: hypothetical protein C4568_01640 [Candidatus Parcubacteria bacterium]